MTAAAPVTDRGDLDETADPLWDRFAHLTPKLRAHVRVFLHSYRGTPWCVLQDRSSRRHFRFGAAAASLLRRLDGRRSVAAAWAELTTAEQQRLPRADVVTLLNRLLSADLLDAGVPVDAGQLIARRRQERWRKRLARWLNPLALQIPLVNPDRALARALPLVRPLLGRTALVAWALLCGWALLQAGLNWPELREHAATRALDPANLLLMMAVYPLIKALHELGHAFTIKAGGGAVHELGIMLLVFMPVPYCDASAAGSFRDKWLRVGVGAAGIIVESAIAAAGLLVWLAVEPGLVRDIAFNLVAIGGVSTILFNGNPLMRLDGYYMLMDAVEIPNLATRSQHYLSYLATRYLFGVRTAASPVTAAGERAWFVGYGLAALAYRLFIVFAIALYIAGQFFVIGVALALYALAVRLLVPLAKFVRFVFASPQLRGRRPQAVIVTVLGAAVVSALLFALPMPAWTRADGIVRLPEDATARAAGAGFVAAVLVSNGDRVTAGTPLIELRDPALTARVSEMEWRREELRARAAAVFLSNPSEAETLGDELAEVDEALAEARARLRRLVVASSSAGTVTIPGSNDLIGRYVRKGDALAHVDVGREVVARVVVPQQNVDRVRRLTRSIEVRSPSRPGISMAGTLAAEVPGASDKLPSRQLGSLGGGAIAVDGRDQSGTRTIDDVFQFDVAIDPGPVPVYPGGRLYLRFNHGSEPLGRQWLRQLRQLLMSRFEV